MAIDFNGVATTDNYSTGFVPKINNAVVALAQLLDPAYASYTGTVPTGAKRISGGLFQQYASGTWSALAMGYVLKAGDTGLAGAQVWGTSGQAAPAFTTRSAGAKVVLYPAIGASSADYAIGVTSSSQWYGVPTTTQSHQWYAGTTLLGTWSGAGVLNSVGGLQVNGQNVWHSGNLTPGNYAPLGGATFTGTVNVPNVSAGDNSTKAANTAFVTTAVSAGVAAALPTGSVITMAANTIPAGYLECNGAAVSRATYSALFSAVGTTYGAGDGTTTFNLPDFRGAFLRGWDNSRGLDPSRVFGSYQADDFASHTHYDGDSGVAPGTTTGGGFALINNAGSGTGSSTAATGGPETRPKNMAVRYAIKT